MAAGNDTGIGSLDCSPIHSWRSRDDSNPISISELLRPHELPGAMRIRGLLDARAIGDLYNTVYLYSIVEVEVRKSGMEG